MALSLSFTGFVEEVKTFDWGSVVTVSHSNRQKNPQGEWETTSRDYIDLSVEPGTEFDWLLSTQKGVRISVTANAKFSTYNKKDGTTGIRIKAWPKEVSAVESRAVDPADAPF